jgi:hypothetical protein
MRDVRSWLSAVCIGVAAVACAGPSAEAQTMAGAPPGPPPVGAGEPLELVYAPPHGWGKL